jgi:hypothetical protein
MEKIQLNENSLHSASTAILHRVLILLIRYQNGAWFMANIGDLIFKFDELNKHIYRTVLVVLIIGIVAYLKYLNFTFIWTMKMRVYHQ